MKSSGFVREAPALGGLSCLVRALDDCGLSADLLFQCIGMVCGLRRSLGTKSRA